MSDLSRDEQIEAVETFGLLPTAHQAAVLALGADYGDEEAVARARYVADRVEAAVRAQVQRDIEARRADLLDPTTPGHLNIRDASSWVTGTRWAAGIANPTPATTVRECAADDTTHGGAR